ncbi:MAG: 4-(cytidine 5'-diphospho)-2-C-methyl-D-erythritol kinase [Kiritimatiellae bacterium]|nr:4-(cytidine 5'-diphospho)-2-C-methyl-D-erythritol kinase [Kiritimatiellia bacterium]
MSCRRLEVDACAKINLTLEVYGLRPDGYHALRSVVLPISLHDTLSIEESPELATDSGYPDDLILKAARLLAPGRGAFVRVAKRIPAGGGLGGGSADAAAALRGLDRFWNLGKSEAELMAIAAQVGSDVPALLCGKPCWMEGRGEKVTPLSPREMEQAGLPFVLVVAHPGVASSTAEVYRNCDCRLDFPSEKEYNIHPINDLEAAAIRLHPEIGVLKAAMGEGAMMSGSGSCVFKKVRDEAEAARLAGELRARGYWAEIAHTIVR